MKVGSVHFLESEVCKRIEGSISPKRLEIPVRL